MTTSSSIGRNPRKAARAASAPEPIDRFLWTLGAAALAGWLGLLSPASSAIEGITVIGFLGFFVFMIGMGISVLLRQRRVAS